ncbi:MAG TPA: YeeE/YedE thiosulfate transporter family protein [Thermodesulfovibrionales bacterium]|nr:YeeE/YedE thiosulfate transporter family protein [Thermodesulfovibrionales bacterium]
MIATIFLGLCVGMAFGYVSQRGLALSGGLLMGLSSAVAAGDNVLHGLSGVPLLAVGSLSFMLFVFIGVWLGVRLKWLQ